VIIKVCMRVIGEDFPIEMFVFLRCPAGPFASNRSLGGPQPLKRGRMGDRLYPCRQTMKF
jgi:hypothetical protein